MERRFYSTNHTQYIYRTRAREHNNTMQKLTLNYTRLQEHTHLLIHVHEHAYVVYVHVFILRICARRR